MILEQYVFFFLVFTISAYFLYTRIRYPFWSHMPVSHTYDLIQIFNGVIQSNPKRNKFTNPALVKTASFFELGDDQQKAATQLFNCFYIPSDVIFSTLSPEILKTRMTGHLGTPFVSADPSFSIGCAVSYPVNIIHGTGQTVANYLAYLATDRDQNISRALISTHDFNARTMNPNVSSTIYKKHVGKCAGAHPLVEFKTSVFYINVEGSDLGLNAANATALATHAHIIQIYKPNWNLLQDYLSCISSGTQSCLSSGTQSCLSSGTQSRLSSVSLSSVSGTKSMTALFDFVAIVDIGALSARVDANQLFVYAYRIGTQIVALYFIEDMNTLYENVADYGGKTLSLVASVNNILEPDGIAVFYNGFVEAVQKISKQNRDYKMMVIDDVGHNAQIVERTKLVKSAIFETEGGYYWINHRTVNCERCLILI